MESSQLDVKPKTETIKCKARSLLTILTWLCAETNCLYIKKIIKLNIKLSHASLIGRWLLFWLSHVISESYYSVWIFFFLCYESFLHKTLLVYLIISGAYVVAKPSDNCKHIETMKSHNALAWLPEPLFFFNVSWEQKRLKARSLDSDNNKMQKQFVFIYRKAANFRYSLRTLFPWRVFNWRLRINQLRRTVRWQKNLLL